VSDAGQHPAEGGFGPPPGARAWPEPGPPSRPAAYPPPSGAPAFPPPSGPPVYPAPPAQQGYPAQPAYPAQQAYPGQQPYPARPAYPGPAGQPAYPAYAPAATSSFPVSTFLLLVVSVISLIATGILGIPSAIMSVVAWRRSATDPTRARTLTMTGWIVYAANFAVGIPLLIWFYVWALSNQ
jgi:hypothetical protein